VTSTSYGQTLKMCRGCKQSLPADRFGVVHRNKSLRNTRCRACINREARRLRAVARAAGAGVASTSDGRSGETGSCQQSSEGSSRVTFTLSNVVPDSFVVTADTFEMRKLSELTLVLQTKRPDPNLVAVVTEAVPYIASRICDQFECLSRPAGPSALDQKDAAAQPQPGQQPKHDNQPSFLIKVLPHVVLILRDPDMVTVRKTNSNGNGIADHKMRSMSPIHLEQAVCNVQDMAEYLSHVPRRLGRALDQALAGEFRGYALFGVHELVVTLCKNAAAERRDWTSGSTRDFLEELKAAKRERVGKRLDAQRHAQLEQEQRERERVVVAEQTQPNTQSPVPLPLHRDSQGPETSTSSTGGHAEKSGEADIDKLKVAAVAAPTAAVNANHAGIYFVNKPTPGFKPAPTTTTTAKASTAVAPKSK